MQDEVIILQTVESSSGITKTSKSKSECQPPRVRLIVQTLFRRTEASKTIIPSINFLSELDALYSKLEMNKKKLSLDRINLFGKTILDASSTVMQTQQFSEESKQLSGIKGAPKSAQEEQPKLRTLSPYQQLLGESEIKYSTDRNACDLISASFRQDEVGRYSAETNNLRQSAHSIGSSRTHEIYIDTAPALLGDQSPIDLYELYNGRAS